MFPNPTTKHKILTNIEIQRTMSIIVSLYFFLNVVGKAFWLDDVGFV
jgi:hypothetical protein